MPVLTPRLGLSKPIIDGDDDVWGDFLNDNADILDAQVMRPADVAALYLPLAGGTMTGSLLLKANAAAPLEAVTLQQLTGGYLPLTGGTLSGALTLRTAMPAANYEATPKLYVDNGLAAKIGDAPADNQYWVRRNNAWALSPGGMLDAPSDGFSYMRLNGAWSSGGLLSSGLTVNGAFSAVASRTPAGLIVDTRGNVGIGYVPPATAAQADGGATGGWLFQWGMTANNWASGGYYDGSAWRYLRTGTFWQQQMVDDRIVWQYAPSGAKDAAVSGVTQPMALDTTALTLSVAGLTVNAPVGQYPTLVLNKPAANIANQIIGKTNGSTRWTLYLGEGTPESGGNVGSTFAVANFDDSGALLGFPFSIDRANGRVNAGALAVGGNASVGGDLVANNGVYVAYNVTSQYLLAGDANNLWLQFQNGWYFGWNRSTGDLSWNNPSSGALMIINGAGTMNLAGNLYSPGTVQGAYVQSTGSIMNYDGRYFVANNQAYWIGRNAGDGRWLIVDNGNTLMSVDTNGVMIASSSVHAVGGQMGMFNGGSGRVMQMSPSWYWDWNISTGTLIWYNPNRGPEWIIRSDGWCYNDWSAVGGHGPFIDFSDERSKADIQPATAGLDAVLRLNPIWFKRIRRIKDTMVTDDREDIGFSAQQLRDVIPEAVMEAGFSLPDGTGGMDDAEPSLGMATTPIVAALVNAVRELTTRIEELEQTS